MKNRRGLFLSLMTAVVALTFVAASVLADELLGVLTKVDVEGKTVTVVDKETDQEVEVKITGDTEYVTKKGAVKVDLEKVGKQVTKAKDRGRKGLAVKVTHDKRVASKITIERKKGGD